jgi:SAM-dependent methyltransferase
LIGRDHIISHCTTTAVMNQPAEINAYWTKRGQTYEGESRLAGHYHRLQESFLIDILKLGGLPTRSILEIGCGFGRITKALAHAFPRSAITAIDLSEDQLANARRYCGDCANITFACHDLYSEQPLPHGRFDVALAVEVFLHHPSRPVRAFLDRIAESADHFVNIDWCEDWQAPVSNHVWIHNYRALYREAGLTSVSFAFPEKVDGKQQRLFVAGRSLPEPLHLLENLLQHYTPQAAEPAWESGTQTPRTAVPENWDLALRTSATELLGVIPEGAAFILVDDGQWPGTNVFSGRRVIPFIEREGRWWGPPENDEIGLRELERLRAQGAAYFVYTWPSFWWMEHYARFSQHLRQNFPCLLQNERVIVYQLTG